MKIALTFDDGPHPRYTPQILNILDKYGIKATFFTIGINAEYYPHVVEEIIKRGHEIGNHTYSHPHVSCLNSENLKREVERCESVIFGLTDYKTKLQQLVQQDGNEELSYFVVSAVGPEHDKLFEVEARINSNVVGRGNGKSKRDAEQNAAREALLLFGLKL